MCKMCGEKQSLLKIYGEGSGADCRCHVQKLNMLQGEMALASEMMAETSEGLTESIHEQVEQKENWNLQDEINPSVNRWEKYMQESTEGLCTAEDEGEESAYTTDRKQLCEFRRKAVRARRNDSQSNCGRGDQQCHGQGRSLAVSQAVGAIEGSLETWKGSTARPRKIKYDVRMENSRSPELLPKPEVHETLPFEQPCASSSKWGRFLSSVESCENVSYQPYSEGVQNPYTLLGTSASTGFLQSRTQQANEDCMKPDKGDWNGNCIGSLTKGSFLPPHKLFLCTKGPPSVNNINIPATTDICQDSQFICKTLSATDIKKEAPPIGSSQSPKWLSHGTTTPLQSVPHAGTAAQRGLFQTDEDFDDDI
ncbi:MRN complex-interacting protein isoform X2 [Lissotriton helveticus]